MKEETKIIKWFSGLDLEICQEIANPLHLFLKNFKGIKDRKGEMWCRIKPCQKHQYSRGVCSRHYQLLKSIARHPQISWLPLARLGLCRFTHNEIKDSYEMTLPKKDDPLRVLLK